MTPDKPRTFHNRCMVADRPDGAGCASYYEMGHRDACHACAKIAAEADAEIARLRALVERYKTALKGIQRLDAEDLIWAQRWDRAVAIANTALAGGEHGR